MMGRVDILVSEKVSSRHLCKLLVNNKAMTVRV